MNLRKATLGSALCIGLLTGAVTVAQNVNPHRNPNLAAAQRLIDQAISRIDAAQQANEYDMGGHAAKAKEFLSRANEELKAAAEDANHHR